MKDNVKVIHFDIKARSELSLVFAQIAFEKDTANFYFDNEEVNIKTLISIKRFRIFTHFYTTLHSIRTCFMKLVTAFISRISFILEKLSIIGILTLWLLLLRLIRATYPKFG